MQGLGGLFIGCSGIPLFASKCSEPSCLGATSNIRFSVTFKFPTKPFHKAVGLDFAWNRWQRPSAGLRMYNIVPYESLWMEAAWRGDLFHLKELIAECPARVNDVNEFGDSAVDVSVNSHDRHLLAKSVLNPRTADEFARSQCSTVETTIPRSFSCRLEQTCQPKLPTSICEYPGSAEEVLALADYLRTPRNRHFTLYAVRKSERPSLEEILPPRVLDNVISDMPELHRTVIGFLHADMRRLLRNHPNRVNVVDADGRTALWWAAATGANAHVRILLEHDADVDIQDADRISPLMAACLWNNADATTIDLLLTRKPDVSSITLSGENILHKAAMCEHSRVRRRVFRYGLAQGIDPNAVAPGCDSTSPVHQLAYYSNDGMQGLQILIDAGANLDAADARGITAAHYAIQGQWPKNVQRLHDEGASFREVTDSKCTTLHYAARDANADVLRTLLGLNRGGVDAMALNCRNRTGLHAFDYYTATYTPPEEQGGRGELRELLLDLIEKMQYSSRSATLKELHHASCSTYEDEEVFFDAEDLDSG